jgi:ABC-type Fe3+-hydroxamate transport system substrate-binding protein
VPSQTELLYDLGLDNEVVGVTKFCVHPENWFKSKTRIGGTKNVNIETVSTLQPDLIIANKEENLKEQVEALQKIAPVWVSDVNDLPGALSMIRSVGELVYRSTQAEKIIKQIEQHFQTIATVKSAVPAAYLIWKDPYMTVGGDTFISDMMQRAGFMNVFGKLHRYPEVTFHDILSSGCKVILLSSEPYPFKQKDIDALKPMFPAQDIILVDGEMFSWYGSRLQLAPSYFTHLLQPGT